MRNRFKEEKCFANKAKNDKLFTIDQYMSFMIKVKESRNKTIVADVKRKYSASGDQNVIYLLQCTTQAITNNYSHE